jgi:HPt (histidine-containing phosphotransfer) domain-containing protein
MTRDERIQTSVCEDVKTDFRVEAAKRDMDMSELLRELIHDFLDEQSEQEENPNTKTTPAD